MIVSFSVANFRSIAGEQTLSLVADDRFAETHPEHAVPIPDSDLKVLRTAVLYGANAAGKSNIFKALRYLRIAALKARPKNAGTGRDPFRFGSEAETQPSSFDLQFIASGKLYRYGLVVDDHRILEEWLVRVERGGETPLYERTSNGEDSSSIKADDLLSTGSEKLAAMVTVVGPPNQSFLAFIRSTLDASEYGKELGSILNWFDNLFPIPADGTFLSLGKVLDQVPGLQLVVDTFLKFASTGIDHLELSRKVISEEEARKYMLVRHALDREAQGSHQIVPLRGGNGESRRWVERTAAGQYNMLTIQAAHAHYPGKVDLLELSEESDGTRRLLNFVPMLLHSQVGCPVFVIDEIDRSMHPILVRKFLEVFLAANINLLNQIILTTHESTLLDLELLRRDEIWFVEKNAAGASHLYSLADFEIRESSDVRKHYLQGRFGAIPFVGNLDRLVAQTEVENRGTVG